MRFGNVVRMAQDATIMVFCPPLLAFVILLLVFSLWHNGVTFEAVLAVVGIVLLAYGIFVTYRGFVRRVFGKPARGDEVI